MDQTVPGWLEWARELHQIGQTGLYYTQNEFDRQRYQRLIDISADIIQNCSGLDLDNIKVALSAQPGYVTPKMDVRGAIFDDNKVLMVQEITDGCWSLPGGWADVNVSPSGMVEKEVWEETGLRVKAVKMVGLYEANHDREPLNVFHAYKAVFLCQTLSGELTTSYETPQVSFFPIEQLPNLSIYRTQERLIREAYAHFLDPTLQTVFD